MTVMVTGWVRPGDHPISTNCVWVEEDNRSLNLEKATDRHHLRDDAVTAEDVAIRWADQYYGHAPEYDRRRNDCMEALFKDIASHHRVDMALVRQYRFRMDRIPWRQHWPELLICGFMVFGLAL